MTMRSKDFRAKKPGLQLPKTIQKKYTAWILSSGISVTQAQAFFDKYDQRRAQRKSSDEEYMEGCCSVSYLSETQYQGRGGIQTYVKRLSLFKMPLTESRKEWERTYCGKVNKVFTLCLLRFSSV